MPNDENIERKFYSLDERDFQHLPLRQWDDIGISVYHYVQMFVGYGRPEHLFATRVRSERSLANFNFNRFHRQLSFEIVQDNSRKQWYTLNRDPYFDAFELYFELLKNAYSPFSHHYKISDYLIDKVRSINDKWLKTGFVKDVFSNVLRDVFSLRERKTNEEWERYSNPMDLIYGYSLASEEETKNTVLEWTQTKRLRDWCLDVNCAKFHTDDAPGLHIWAVKIFNDLKKNLAGSIQIFKNSGVKIIDPYEINLQKDVKN